MYGGKGDSEALLCGRIVKQLPQGSIVIADAGLGIFRVAYDCIKSRHDILFRLSVGRFKSMTKNARLVSKRFKSQTLELAWKPSKKDLKGCSGANSSTTLNVLIHEAKIKDGEFLYVVTTLAEDAQSCADRYAERYDVETDIKCVKVAMGTENITAKSEEMVMKELYTSLTAYNLVIQFRRQAADVSGVPPRRLSFQAVWDTYESFLSTFLATEGIEACVDRFELALSYASRAKIPNRPGRRLNAPRTRVGRKQRSGKKLKEKSNPSSPMLTKSLQIRLSECHWALAAGPSGVFG